VPSLGTGPAAARPAVPRTPVLPVAIDAYAPYQGQAICSPSVKAGAAKLAALLKATYGPASIGIGRACSVGGQSEHKEGRALDWMQSIRVPAQRAHVQAFLAWLLAPGADGLPGGMARRLGVMYLGWNNHFWASYRADAGWTDLKGCSTDPAKKASSYDTYCHRNHLHISLSWEGASAYTSFWSGSALAEPCDAGWGAGDAVALGAGADLVPVTPVRVVDSRAGTGLAAPCRLTAAQSWDGTRRDLVAHVTGVGEVPADGVAAVAVRVTAYRSVVPSTTVSVRTTASGALRPVVTALSASSYASTTVVPVASDGTIRLTVDRGSADVLVDVVGWVPIAADPAPALAPPTGRTHLLLPTLVYDGLRTPLRPGETRTVHLGGVGPVPASGLTGLHLTLVAARSSASAYVGVLTPTLRTYVGSLRTSTVTSRTTQVVSPTTDGTVVLRNTGRVPVAARLYANAWVGADPTDGGGTLTLLPAPVKVVDSLARIGLGGGAPSTAARVMNLASSAVPAGAKGVLLAVSATGGTTEGTLVVGSRSGVAAVSFGRAQPGHEVVLLPLGSTGTLAFRTTSLGTQVRAWVLGYVT
jgi:hypothetical protein